MVNRIPAWERCLESSEHSCPLTLLFVQPNSKPCLVGGGCNRPSTVLSTVRREGKQAGWGWALTVEGSFGLRLSLGGVVLAELDAGVYQLPHKFWHGDCGQGGDQQRNRGQEENLKHRETGLSDAILNRVISKTDI
jgi:hypothetical protein